MSDETGQASFARDKRLVNMQDSAVVDYLPDEYPRLRDYLFALIADPDTRVYAVMDGAFFQNIAAKLRDAGLARRSLYRYGGDYSVVMGGPWLIDPYQQENSGNLSIETGNVSNEQRITEITSRFEAILQLAADTSGLDSRSDIFVDKQSNMYAGPRQGTGTPQRLGINIHGL